MAETLLSQQDIEERLSLRYAQAVAERAGFTTWEPNLDRNGIDLQIEAGGPRSPKLDVQLKATTNLRQREQGGFSYPLAVRNYSLLTGDSVVPRILVVLDLPNDPGRWLEISDDALLLRHRAYWRDLAGEPPTSNSETVSVHLLEEQVFTVTALHELMDRAATGRL